MGGLTLFLCRAIKGTPHVKLNRAASLQSVLNYKMVVFWRDLQVQHGLIMKAAFLLMTSRAQLVSKTSDV